MNNVENKTDTNSKVMIEVIEEDSQSASKKTVEEIQEVEENVVDRDEVVEEGEQQLKNCNSFS